MMKNESPKGKGCKTVEHCQKYLKYKEGVSAYIQLSATKSLNLSMTGSH